MYYAQEYISLPLAVVVSAAIAVVVIGVRAVTLMGAWRAVAGVVVRAAVMLAVTRAAAIWPQLQGILITALGLGLFVAAMMLMPHVSASGSGFWRVMEAKVVEGAG
jgi:hypothetical protein